MDGVEIRRATPVDKQAIIDISGGVYDGLDYLEDCYDSVFMKDPNVTPYVAVYNGEIVAFAAAYVVDGGDTVVSRAGRVKQALSGRGIYKNLNHHCLVTSGASENAFTSANTNTALNTQSFREQNTLVLTRSLTRYDFNTPRLKQICWNYSNANCLKVLTESLLQHYMTSAVFTQYLFPKCRLISDWIPYKLLQSNIPFILNGDRRTLRLTDVRSHGDNMQGLLTMSKIYIGANGATVCMLDIYGTDTDSLTCHLASQLEFLCENSRDNIIMLVFTEPQFERSSLEKAFEELAGLSKTIWRSPNDGDSLFTTQCLFEKSVKVAE